MAIRDDMDDNADKTPEEQLQQDLDRAREALQAATPTEETPALNLELEDGDDQPAHPNTQGQMIEDAKLGEFGAKSGTIETETAKKRLEEERLEGQRAARTAAAISAAAEAAEAAARLAEDIDNFAKEAAKESEETQEVLQESAETLYDFKQAVADMSDAEMELGADSIDAEAELQRLKDSGASPEEILAQQEKLNHLNEAIKAQGEFNKTVDIAIARTEEKQAELQERQQALNEKVAELQVKKDNINPSAENSSEKIEAINAELKGLEAEQKEINVGQEELKQNRETLKNSISLVKDASNGDTPYEERARVISSSNQMIKAGLGMQGTPEEIDTEYREKVLTKLGVTPDSMEAVLGPRYTLLDPAALSLGAPQAAPETVQSPKYTLLDPAASHALADSLSNVASGVRNQVSENRGQKQEFSESRDELITERDGLRESIEQSGGTQEQKDRLQELNNEIAKSEDIDQYRHVTQQKLGDQINLVGNVKADSSLTDVEKTGAINTLAQTSMKGYFSDTTVMQTTPGDIGSEDGHLLYTNLKMQLASLDPDSPHTQKLYDTMRDNGFKFQTRDGQLLEGQAAVDTLRADVDADRYDIVKGNIEWAIDDAMMDEESIDRSQLDAIYANHKATPEMMAEIESGLKVTDNAVAENTATATTDKQEPLEVAAATGAVSGETETTTGDADQWSGTESQELNTSEEYQAALTGEGGIYGQIENGQISEAALDKVPEHLRPQVLAALERDNIEVVKPENSPGQESQIPGIDVADAGQIKNFLADTLGAENAEITMNTASAAMIAAFPFLAAFRGPEIADPQDQPSAHGISYGGYKSFADNEFRETDEPGVDASYNVPAAYAQNAQDVSNTFHASHDNQPTAGADGSGDSSSSTQDLEAQAQEQLLAAQRAQQQMQQMMPGNDGPNEPKPDDGFMA